jgi:hypothetical protein
LLSAKSEPESLSLFVILALGSFLKYLFLPKGLSLLYVKEGVVFTVSSSLSRGTNSRSNPTLSTGLSTILAVFTALSTILAVFTALSTIVAVFTALSTIVAVFTALSTIVAVFTALSTILAVFTALSTIVAVFTALSTIVAVFTALSTIVAVFTADGSSSSVSASTLLVEVSVLLSVTCSGFFSLGSLMLCLTDAEPSDNLESDELSCNE